MSHDVYRQKLSGTLLWHKSRAINREPRNSSVTGGSAVTEFPCYLLQWVRVNFLILTTGDCNATESECSLEGWAERREGDGFVHQRRSGEYALFVYDTV